MRVRLVNQWRSHANIHFEAELDRTGSTCGQRRLLSEANRKGTRQQPWRKKPLRLLIGLEHRPRPEHCHRAALRSKRPPTACRARRRADPFESGSHFCIRRSRAQSSPAAISDDILGAGVIASLSRPGGNTTGLTILSPELSAKRLEVLRDIIPGLSRVTALWDPTTGASQVTMTTSAALSLNLKLEVLEVRRREEVAAAVRAARNSQADALNVFSSPILASLHREIIAFAAEYRLPAIYQWKEHVEAGGLVSYEPGLAAIWRQSAIIVAKVLKGVKPADLPVEQPTKFDLALNLGTAKSLDLTIPPSILLRADEVIE